jgi:hypothetical protein
MLLLVAEDFEKAPVPPGAFSFFPAASHIKGVELLEDPIENQPIG